MLERDSIPAPGLSLLDQFHPGLDRGGPVTHNRRSRPDRQTDAYERAGVRKAWFVDPTDRILTVHLLEGGHYGHPMVMELRRRTEIWAIPGVSIDWDGIVAALA